MDINNLVEEILSIYKQKVGESNLANTATYNVEWNGDVFEVYFNLQHYWKYLEKGTKPHFPPVDAIERWITVKKIVPYAVQGKVPSTRQLAFMICKSISKKGTAPRNYLSETLRESEGLIQEIMNELTNQLEREVNNLIVEL